MISREKEFRPIEIFFRLSDEEGETSVMVDTEDDYDAHVAELELQEIAYRTLPFGKVVLS
jgi:hypothetical protein